MREIKFRAWDGKQFRNILDTTICFSVTGDLLVGDLVENEMFEETFERYPLMQFTGLRDKNGVEIYEGDVLGACVMNTSIVNCEVTFYQGSFCIRTLSGERFGDLLSEYATRVAVIGNVHEHPELLEAK